MTRIAVNEVASELEYLRWFYHSTLKEGGYSKDGIVNINSMFTGEFLKNPPEQYEVKDEDGNIIK